MLPFDEGGDLVVTTFLCVDVEVAYTAQQGFVNGQLALLKFAGSTDMHQMCRLLNLDFRHRLYQQSDSLCKKEVQGTGTGVSALAKCNSWTINGISDKCKVSALQALPAWILA